LWSRRHRSGFSRASAREKNNSVFEHSSRSFPLKLSMNPFSTGFPGRRGVRLHAVPISPIVQGPAAKLAAVVHRDGLGLASHPDQPCQGIDHPPSGQRSIGFQDRAFPAVVGLPVAPPPRAPGSSPPVYAVFCSLPAGFPADKDGRPAASRPPNPHASIGSSAAGGQSAPAPPPVPSAASSKPSGRAHGFDSGTSTAEAAPARTPVSG